MLITLVGAMLEENLALAYLASSLRAGGHRVDVLAFDGPGSIHTLVGAIMEKSPGMVGMSVAFQHRLTDFRDLSKALREAGSDAAIVWGGHIPTARPGRILDAYPWVDVTVRHDAERTIVELADALGSSPLAAATAPDEARVIGGGLFSMLSGVDGLAFRLPDGRLGSTPAREAERDLDALIPPARDARPARHAGLPFAPVLSSRGCWQSCAYCSIQTYHRGRKGPRVRFRDPDAVAAEMAGLYLHDGVRIFCFHDENLFLPKPKRTLERMRALRAGLDRRGVGRIGIVAKCRPDELTAELLEQTRRMGLLRVYVGIENGSQAGLDHLGRATTVDACRTSLGLLRDAGVFACFNVLLFEPDTTMSDVRDNIEFLRDFNDFPWNFCRAEVYPGSMFESRLKEQGRLRGGLEGLGYEIADPAAEVLFRMTAVAFGGRNFGQQSTANSASSLGYVAAVLDRFHRGGEVRDLVRRTGELVSRFGTDTLNFLDEAATFVERGDAFGPGVREFTAGLAARIADHDAVFWREIEDLRRAMDRYGIRHAGEADGSRKEGGLAFAKAAAVIAAATFTAQGCDKSTTVDPAPGDAEVMVMDPPPPDTPDVPYLDVDPAPEEITIYDPVPPDVKDAQDEDIQIADPPPPDVIETQDEDIQIADPPPQDIPMYDPPPPDVKDVQDEDAGFVKYEIPPVDPLPPDMNTPPRQGTPRASLPLDRSFRVSLDAEPVEGGVELVASVPEVRGVDLEWSAIGGSLKVDGARATFTPDGSRDPMVMVRASANGDLLDVARYLP